MYSLEEALALPDGIFENVPEDVYHKLPWFSASYARQLIVNPALAQIPVEDKPSLTLGLGIHALKLEGRDALNARFAFVPADAPKKPTDKQREAARPSIETVNSIHWWDLFAQQNQGKTILSADDKVIIEGACQAIDTHPCVIKRKMFQSGMNEVTIIYTDRETGIRIKSRLDNLDEPYINDLKSTADSSIFAFQRSIEKYGYRLQGGAYSIAAASVGIEIEEVRLVAVSTKPPYTPLVGAFTSDALQIGQLDFCRALTIEAECRELRYYPNVCIPPHLPSLFEIYRVNCDGELEIKSDADLFHYFEIPRWLA